MDSCVNPAPTGLRQRYSALSTGLSWDTSFQPDAAVNVYHGDEGLRVHDAAAIEDPLHQTLSVYCKTQNEKDKRLYALVEAFAQNNGQLGISDARYVNALKIILQTFTPLEYTFHRVYAHLARQLPGDALRIACQIQSADSLRHCQIQSHALSHYNKYFGGLHHAPHWFDHAWYLAPAKSFADDVFSAGPWESLVAVSFCFENIFSNLLFVPFMTGAARNGDLSTASMGYSRQSDAVRAMGLGTAVVRFLVRQDPANLPIVQGWIDKWFWRGFRLMSLVAMAQDYMLIQRSTSWQTHWTQYVEGAAGALFADLAEDGLRLPAGWGDACDAKAHLSHQTFNGFYGHSGNTAFNTWAPADDELNWLAGEYPATFRKYYRPRLEYYRERQSAGQRWRNPAAPMVCRICHFPTWFTRPGQPRRVDYAETEVDGRLEHFCSAHCQTIFEAEPAKYAQSKVVSDAVWVGDGTASVYQSAQLGFDVFGATLAAAKIKPEQDGGEFIGSPDDLHFSAWAGGRSPREGRV